MSFSVNVVTQQGLALLSQATAGNPIVFVSSVSSETAYTEQQLKEMSSPGSWTGPSGTVSSASSMVVGEQPAARIVVSYGNQAQTKTLKSFGVVARLQSSTEEFVLAAVSDSNASIRVPDLTSVPVYVQVAINIALSDAETITVTTSSAGSASLGDLDRLVSCHAAGDATTGEDQTIRGMKIFEDEVHIRDYFFVENDASVDIAPTATVRFDRDEETSGHPTAIVRFGGAEVRGQVENERDVVIVAGDLAVVSGEIRGVLAGDHESGLLPCEDSADTSDDSPVSVKRGEVFEAMICVAGNTSGYVARRGRRINVPGSTTPQRNNPPRFAMATSTGFEPLGLSESSDYGKLPDGEYIVLHDVWRKSGDTETTYIPVLLMCAYVAED